MDHHNLPRTTSLRWRGHSQQEAQLRGLSRAASSIRAGLRTNLIFQKMDDPEEVVFWLHTIDLHQYVPAFREHSVTGNTLLSLNSVELRNTLGVTKLSDRRQLLDGIAYLAQTLCVETKRTIPEDGRILTHLSNERIFLVWVRLSLILHTVALVTLRLRNAENGENGMYVRLVSCILAVLAVFSVLYGTCRYYGMHRMVEYPGEGHVPRNAGLIAPVLIVVSAGAVSVYALMSNSTEEAAALALMAI